ncbi:MAG: PspC domain-containing protein [Prevotella sp.]|nr:PspC domain-containing protein [Prevotella sp.]
MEPKRMHLSSTDKKLGGVCGGLGEYFEIDSTIIRIFFVFFTLIGGSGLLLYFLIWILAPKGQVL